MNNKTAWIVKNKGKDDNVIEKPIDKAYQLRDVSFFYERHQAALSLQELNISAGKVTALIGANGSGKTTLLNLLGFLTSPNKGEMNFFAKKICLKDYNICRTQIGFLAQKPYMLRGTVWDNLALVLKLHQIPKSQYRQKIDNVLDILQLQHLKHQSAKHLSGGELQKVALARALIIEPKVLLMDEPFSYLDQVSALHLENFIKQYKEYFETTLIFSTHNRLQGLALADEVISLAKGKLIASPLVNLFTGMVKNSKFVTENIEILCFEKNANFQHASINPDGIVLSKEKLDSSMRNHYQGRVVTIAEEGSKIRIAVQAGELFQVLITKNSLQELMLHLGDNIWVSFKSNSVTFF